MRPRVQVPTKTVLVFSTKLKQPTRHIQKTGRVKRPNISLEINEMFKQ